MTVEPVPAGGHEPPAPTGDLVRDTYRGHAPAARRCRQLERDRLEREAVGADQLELL